MGADALQLVLLFFSGNPLEIWALRLVDELWHTVVPRALRKIQGVIFKKGMIRDMRLVASLCPNLLNISYWDSKVMIRDHSPFTFVSYAEGHTLVTKKKCSERVIRYSLWNMFFFLIFQDHVLSSCSKLCTVDRLGVTPASLGALRSHPSFSGILYFGGWRQWDACSLQTLKDKLPNTTRVRFASGSPAAFLATCFQAFPSVTEVHFEDTADETPALIPTMMWDLRHLRILTLNSEFKPAHTFQLINWLPEVEHLCFPVFSPIVTKAFWKALARMPKLRTMSLTIGQNVRIYLPIEVYLLPQLDHLCVLLLCEKENFRTLERVNLPPLFFGFPEIQRPQKSPWPSQSRTPGYRTFEEKLHHARATVVWSSL